MERVGHKKTPPDVFIREGHQLLLIVAVQTCQLIELFLEGLARTIHRSEAK